MPPPPASLRGVRGLLLDLDGTLYGPDGLIPGAAEAVARLRAAGLALCCVTNTTRQPRTALVERLGSLGLPVSADELFTAPVAAVAWLEAHGVRTVALHVAPAAAGEFGRFTIDEARPQAVVVGDLGPAWTFERLNRAFRQLGDRATLLAIQKNRYWRAAEGLVLDAGPFVAALEYASGRQAVVVGKPSAAFLAAAAAGLGLPLAEVALVGDDVVSDVGGALAAGARGILVRTGKFRPGDLDAAGVRPTAVIDSVAALPHLLGV